MKAGATKWLRFVMEGKMLEAERVRLYNDLSDYEQELKGVLYPKKTREIDIIHRAIVYVRGVQGRWLVSSGIPVFDENKKLVDYLHCSCDRCKFNDGKASFRYCPNCGAKMK